MKKRLIIVFMFALCCMSGAMFSSFGAARAETVADACDGSHTGYSAIAPTSTMTLTSGKYYLTANTRVDYIINGDVTLCLNGKVATGSGQGAVIKVNNGASLKLCSCATTTHYYSKVGDKYVVNDSLNPSSPTTFSFAGGAVTGGNAEKGGGICALGSSLSPATSVSINGVNIVGNTATSGGGIFAEKSVIKMQNSSVIGNTATSDGGGIYIDNKGILASNASFTSALENCIIEKNSATIASGGAVAQVGAKTVMNGGKIADNWASVAGGGVAVYSGAFVMGGGEISANTALSYGGGVRLLESQFTLSGGKISANTSNEDGGGILIDAGSTFIMSGGEISANTATAYGGGVSLRNSTSDFSMSGGTISANTAVNGGGVYLDQGEASFAGGVITANSVTGLGGGVYANQNIKLSGGAQIKDNLKAGNASSNIFMFREAGILDTSIIIDAIFTGRVGVSITDNTNGAVLTRGYAQAASTGSLFYDDTNFAVAIVNQEYTIVSAFYTVTFTDNIMPPVNVEQGGTIGSITAPDKAGYTFVGWQKGGVDFDTSAPITQDIELTAKYEKATYTITYNLNGGAGADNATYAIDSATITLPTPTKSGYTFGGWYSSSSFSGEAVTEIASGSSGNKVFYAKFNAINYTITYNLNGGAGADNATYTIASPTITLPTPTKSAHAFGGWYSSSDFSGEAVTEIASGSSENKVFYAKWTEIKQTVTITFTDNILPTMTISMGGTLGFAPAPAKAGYNFVEWQSGGVAFDFSAPVTQDIELTAIYELTNYTITYNLNGGTGVENATYTILGSAITLPTPTKNGYTFGGWYVDAELSGFAITEIAGGSVGNKVFYAKWTANPIVVIEPTGCAKGCGSMIGGGAGGLMGVAGIMVALLACAIIIRAKKHN